MRGLVQRVATAVPRGSRFVWRGQDKWRDHPSLTASGWELVPGLKRALVLFAGYVVVDTTLRITGVIGADDHSHGGHGGHGDSHHGHDEHGNQGKENSHWEEVINAGKPVKTFD